MLFSAILRSDYVERYIELNDRFGMTEKPKDFSSRFGARMDWNQRWLVLCATSV